MRFMPSFFTFNRLDGSPSRAFGAALEQLTPDLLFTYVPADQVSAVVIVAPAAMAETYITIELFGENGQRLNILKRTLIGDRPMALLANDLFRGTAPSDVTIRVHGDRRTGLAGTTFIFNEKGQPSMSAALSLHGGN